MIDMNQFGKKRKASVKAVQMATDEAKALHEKALEAAAKAAAACKPIPMIVGEAKSLFSNEIDYSKPVEYVADGVCGFAWIEIRPARWGIVEYFKANKIGRYDDYRKCWYISASGVGNQSMQIKEAWAGAFAKVLSDAGVNAYMNSKMD